MADGIAACSVGALPCGWAAAPMLSECINSPHQPGFSSLAKMYGIRSRMPNLSGGIFMMPVANRTSTPWTRSNLPSLNQTTSTAVSRHTVASLNRGRASQPLGSSSASPRPAPVPQPVPAPQSVTPFPVPPLLHPLQKGQKTALALSGARPRLTIGVGWSVTNPRCDVDVSAFLLTSNNRVLGDDWFVFYGQNQSPDRSVLFHSEPAGGDRQHIDVDLSRLDTRICKIALVLTIHEALEQKLNFSMIRDAYIRILSSDDHKELLSYQMADYYSNVTSMTIGELYLHNQQWKFNPVGNGVSQDLAGQCAIYGVEIS